MKRTYLDSSVLIQAVHGVDAGLTLKLLEDPEREFVAATFLRLETLPQPTFHKREAEIAFMKAYFDKICAWAKTSDDLLEKALAECSHAPLSAVDGIHLAAAKELKADEFITAEKPGKPLYKAKGLKVIYLPNVQVGQS